MRLLVNFVGRKARSWDKTKSKSMRKRRRDSYGVAGDEFAFLGWRELELVESDADFDGQFGRFVRVAELIN
jgi:hypothetical protein